MTAGGWLPLFCEGGEGQDARNNNLSVWCRRGSYPRACIG